MEAMKDVIMSTKDYEKIQEELKEKENEEVLFEDKRTLEDIVKEVAEEEGLTYEETMELFKKGMKMLKGNTSPKNKVKSKAKRKSAKQARRKNRK